MTARPKSCRECNLLPLVEVAPTDYEYLHLIQIVSECDAHIFHDLRKPYTSLSVILLSALSVIPLQEAHSTKIRVCTDTA